MTWAKIDDRFNDDPKLLQLPRGVRLLHVEGLVWACRHETDGAIPRFMLPKVTDEPDVLDAVKQLVAAGLWDDTEDGWQVVDFTKDQRSRAEVEKDREFWRESKVRTRKHKAGDHSLCTNPRYCDHVSSRTPTETPPGSPPEDSRLPDPTRPDPTSREGKGKGSSGDSPSPAAPPGGSASDSSAAEAWGMGEHAIFKIDLGPVPNVNTYKKGIR